MTTKLDFKIGRVSNDNDAFITGAIKDISSLTTETLEAAASTLEFVRVAGENTSQLIRQPIKTTFSLANWKKLLLTLPAVGSDVLMKASRLPFSTLDNGILYTVNNNLERIIDFTKANTTRLAGNIISKNGDSRFKLLRGLGIAIEGTGDAIGAVIKAPSGILAKGTSVIDEVLAKGTTKTHGWVNNLRVGDKDFMLKKNFDGITNSSSNPVAANTNNSSDDISVAA